MATTTTNFGFDIPQSSDLVKNGATQIALLGQDIDTFLAGGVGYAAGKNKIINGDFFVNQRSFSSSTTSGAYGFDRWQPINADGTVTYSAQTFTPGAAPVAGYEARNFARIATSGQTLTTARASLNQNIEGVRTLAGETATVSFWAKAASGTPKVALEWQQFMGTTGGSSPTNTYGGQVTLTTSWARYSLTFAVPSLSGATIGTVNDNCAVLYLYTSAGSTFNARTGSLGIQNNTIDFWGVQVEEGSTATPFQTATGTLQGELSACQRYYWRQTPGVAYGAYGWASPGSTTAAQVSIVLPVQMRVIPTSVDVGNLQLANATGTTFAITSPSMSVIATANVATFDVASTGMTANTLLYVRNANNTAGFLGFSAEL
jgi:hypothetical protein